MRLYSKLAIPGIYIQWAVFTKHTFIYIIWFHQAELLKMKKQALETKNFIENQEAEERKLLKIIAEADAERLKQNKEYDRVGISDLAFPTHCILFPQFNAFLRSRSSATVKVVLLKLHSAIEINILRYWSEGNDVVYILFRRLNFNRRSC